MASLSKSTVLLILSLNILFFSLVSANSYQTENYPTEKYPSKGGDTRPVKPVPYPKEKCPMNVIKLGVCANLLNGFVNVVLGKPPSSPECCPLIEDIVDLEAAVCLCTALKANVLGVIDLNLDVALSLILNHCGKEAPSGYNCA